MSWVAAGVAVGSAVMGTMSSLKANKKAKRATKAQAKLTYTQRMEEIRRVRGEQDFVTGQNVAAVAASNLQMTGSSKRAFEATQQQFAGDIAFRTEAARLERTAIRKGAPGSAENFGAIAQGAGSIASTIMGTRG